MIYLVHEPGEELRQFVKQIVYYKDDVTQHRQERFLPDGTSNLVIDLEETKKFIYDNATGEPKQTCQDAWFSGMMTEYLTISSGINAEMVVITFTPCGAYPFLQQSLALYADTVVNADTVFPEIETTLRHQLVKEKEPAQKFQLIETWLSRSLHQLEFPYTVINNAVTDIQLDQYELNLTDVVTRSGYSQKQFIQLFKKYVGITPKQFHRIIRFNEILASSHKKQTIDWGSCAASCGYYDQAHFIRDFQRFSGLNPKHYLQDQGEWTHYVPVK